MQETKGRLYMIKFAFNIVKKYCGNAENADNLPFLFSHNVFNSLQKSICRRRTKTLNFLFVRVENIVGKGENAGNQHFLLFPQRSQKLPFSGSLKVRIVW